MYQSAPEQQGHGDGGHSHGCHGAEGEDGVVPPLAVLLLPGRTPHRGVLSGISHLNRFFFNSCPNSVYVYIAWERPIFHLAHCLSFSRWGADWGWPHANRPGYEHKGERDVWDKERWFSSGLLTSPATHNLGVRSSPGLWGVRGEGTSNKKYEGFRHTASTKTITSTNP